MSETLGESLKRAAEDPSHRPRFYRDFMAAEVYVIEKGSRPESGPISLQKGDKVDLVDIEVAGRRCIPVFSTLAGLQDFVDELGEEAGYLALNGRDLLEIIGGHELVLDPGSAHPKLFTKDEIAAILDGSIWRPH